MASQKENTDFQEAVFSKPAYPLDDAIDWIGAHMDPEDVFSDTTLARWAVDNGYVTADE